MSGSEFVVEPDRWSLTRRQTSAVRGPLKILPHRRTLPLWPVGLGVVGLSLALAFTLASRPAPAPAEPAPSSRVEALPMPRVVGAAQVPVPVAVPAPTEAPSAEPRVTAEVATPPSPAPRPAAPALDVGQIPVLQLDAAAFEARSPPRPRRAGRPSRPRATPRPTSPASLEADSSPVTDGPEVPSLRPARQTGGAFRPIEARRTARARPTLRMAATVASGRRKGSIGPKGGIRLSEKADLAQQPSEPLKRTRRFPTRSRRPAPALASGSAIRPPRPARA